MHTGFICRNLRISKRNTRNFSR